MSRLGRRLVAMLVVVPAPAVAVAPELRPHVVRGIYGGVPQSILDSGQSLREFGLDAVWMGADSFTKERVALLRAQGVAVYAEFDTLHVAGYLDDHPDAGSARSGGSGSTSMVPTGLRPSSRPPTVTAWGGSRGRAPRARPARVGGLRGPRRTAVCSRP